MAILVEQMSHIFVVGDGSSAQFVVRTDLLMPIPIGK